MCIYLNNMFFAVSIQAAGLISICLQGRFKWVDFNLEPQRSQDNEGNNK